jgi:hypothetical protein
MTGSLFFRLLTFFAILSSILSYSVDVESKTKHCFVVHADKGTHCSGSFEILSENSAPISVSVKGPKPVSESYFDAKFFGEGGLDPKETEGSFSFKASYDGDHTMCILNGLNGANPDFKSRVVAFNFRCHTIGDESYEYAGLEADISELREGLDMLKDHQSYMNQREDVHKDILYSINSKVLTWTFLEAFILFAMALWQISYISNFFETKRKM